MSNIVPNITKRMRYPSYSTFSFRVFLILMILSTLMFANIFMVVGLPADSGSRVIGLLWIIITSVFIFSKPIQKINTGYTYLLLIFMLSIILGVFRLISGDFVYIEQFLTNVLFLATPKIIYFVLIYYLIVSLDRMTIHSIFYKYSIMFLLTIVLSLLLYYIFPMHRFVIYEDGLGPRFAALHFELVNFSYTLFTAGIIIIYTYFRSKLFHYIGMILLSVVVYKISLSNYVPLFVGAILLSMLLLNVSSRRLRKTLYLSFFIIMLLVLLALPLALNFLESYLYLFPRASETLTENDPIFIRAYRHIFAMQYFFDHILDFPFGLFNGGIDADLSNIKSWSGGSGLSKIFMDFGLLTIPFLILFVQVCLKLVSKINIHNQRDQMYFILVNISIVYAFMQAGFFNLTVTTIFLLSIRYWRII